MGKCSTATAGLPPHFLAAKEVTQPLSQEQKSQACNTVTTDTKMSLSPKCTPAQRWHSHIPYSHKPNLWPRDVGLTSSEAPLV